ncbi:response regulator transcription factor [Taibaiella lutea]|uniref:Response regulator transcription factor n=1 Tax=Taibaiella lutea TaxID=2608001 RepID=A0A5M6CJ09_9BACT|nr:response regulator transcription factor [Taibaiella lutea]KAA5535007.1 response regulator transcription factor [Taibaiella lutea]
MSETISVALVDDHKLLRNGLSNFIKSNPNFKVVFEADNGIDLQKKIKSQLLPDVVLMDINMPLMDGYDATEWLYKHYPSVKVIALSMYDSEECIIRMLRRGAKGYLLKDTEPSELIKAIQETKDNGYYYTPMVARQISLLINDKENEQKNASVLSEREMELLKYMASEMTYKEIADKMNLSPKTVENHREKICEKLQIKTRVGLVMYAMKNGIVK